MNMKHNDHEELKSLIAPYALGALSIDEERVVRDHVMSCDACMAEADSFSETAASLVLTVDAETPPPELLEEVMARVADQRPAPAGAVRSRWSLFPVLAAAALLVAVAVLSALLLDARGDISRQEQALAQVAGDEGFRMGGGDQGVAAFVPTDEGSLFAASGLEEAPEGHTYQLWLIENGRPTSAGTFDVSGDGTAVLSSPLSLGGFDRVAVSVEPEGGSESPTGPQILSNDSV